MSLSPDDVQHAAKLARLALTPDESREVLEGLNRVMGLIDTLRAVDTRAVEPMSYPLDLVLDAAQRLRPDQATAPDLRALYQAVAPAVRDGLYLVPKVLE